MGLLFCNINGKIYLSNMRNFIKAVCPPVIISILRKVKGNNGSSQNQLYEKTDGSQQDLDIYFTPEMANHLEDWGKDHTWIEIECLLINCRGKVLDIACGTGVNIKALSRFPFLDVYGFDISDLLLSKAREKGVPAEKLRVNDATKTDYSDNEFEYSYSIGSLEHFTEEGIDLFLKECGRYTSKVAFHMIPVSENDKDNGWIKRGQSYFNNSLAWWLERFNPRFSKVYVINSGWKDAGISVGKWFVCIK